MSAEIFEKIYHYGVNYTRFLCMRNRYKIQKRYNIGRDEDED